VARGIARAGCAACSSCIGDFQTGAVGTDQQTAPGNLPDYAAFTTLVGAMLRAGFRPDEAGKVIGGNYVRIFAASAG